MPERFFATDCEGPVSKNDNAMELAGRFLPDGARFFAKISKYDDFLADVEKRPGYRAGDTLKLILPFFKAFGVTEKDLEDFSGRDILLLGRARDTLARISSFMPCYIISTSYSPYIRALCRAIGHPFERSFSTAVPLDSYPVANSELNKIKMLFDLIAGLPSFDWPETAQSLEDLQPGDRGCIQTLNRIFWEEIASLEAGRLLFEIRPVGGAEKALALETISAKLNIPLGNGFYAGDSITDVQAFQEIERAGGLTLSFNGNSYAVREARLACLSATTLPMAVLAEVFNRDGTEGAVDLAAHWSRGRLTEWGIDLDWVEALFPQDGPPAAEVVVLTDENRSDFSRKSAQFRKQVRGEVIGGLG